MTQFKLYVFENYNNQNLINSKVDKSHQQFY